MNLICLLCLLMIIGTITCEYKGVRLEARLFEDVVLPCSLGPEKNIESDYFEWMKDQQAVFMYDGGIHYNNGLPGQDPQFKGRVSHFPDELKNGNASIIIKGVRLSDSGNYSCYFPRLQQQRFYVELLVVPIFKPRPEIEVSDGTPWGWIIGLIVAVIVAVVFGVLYFRERIRPRSVIIAKPPETREMMLTLS